MGLIHSAPLFAARLMFAVGAALFYYIRTGGGKIGFLTGDEVVIGGVNLRKSFVSQKNSPGVTTLGAEVSLDRELWFTTESWIDRSAKHSGLTREIQTGDASFDEAVYIASDSISMSYVLKSNAELRRKVRAQLAIDGGSVWIESGWLKARASGNQLDNGAWINSFAELQVELQTLRTRIGPNDDRAASKMKLVVAILVAFAAYDFASFLELFFRHGDSFVDTSEVVRSAVINSVLGTIVFSAVVIFWLRKTSRAHLLLSRYFLALLLLFGPALFSLYCDFDRYLDNSDVIVERVVRDLNIQERPTSKGTRYTYWGCFDRAVLAGRSGPGASLQIPDCMTLSRSDYESMQRGQGVRFHIGLGTFGHAWYRRIQFLEI